MNILTLLSAYSKAVTNVTMYQYAKSHPETHGQYVEILGDKWIRQMANIRDGIYRRFVRLEGKVELRDALYKHWRIEAQDMDREQRMTYRELLALRAKFISREECPDCGGFLETVEYKSGNAISSYYECCDCASQYYYFGEKREPL